MAMGQWYDTRKKGGDMPFVIPPRVLAMEDGLPKFNAILIQAPLWVSVGVWWWTHRARAEELRAMRLSTEATERNSIATLALAQAVGGLTEELKLHRLVYRPEHEASPSMRVVNAR